MTIVLKNPISNPFTLLLKSRLEKVKERLTDSYIQIALDAHPEMNTKQGVDQIKNAWRGKSLFKSVGLIEAWEKAAGITSKPLKIGKT